MANFAVSSATLYVDNSLGVPVEYCATEVSLSYDAEEIMIQCLNSDTPEKFSGTENWSGTANLGYSDAGMSELWGAEGTVEFAITTSTGAVVTLWGEIVITSVSSVFNKNEVPTVSITFVGSGQLSEDIS